MSKMLRNRLFFRLAVLLSLFLSSTNSFAKSDLPSWFEKPRQNDGDTIYGIAEGFTLEEATKYALADAAGRLMVSISAESELIREEDKNSFNEELRQKAKQSIEKISFVNYKVSKSEELEKRFYVEVSIERPPFITEQRDRVEIIQRKINDFDKDSTQSNPIQRRNNLIKILDLCKELEIKARILSGAKDPSVDLKSILSLISKYQHELEKSSTNIEFVFEENSSKELVQLIRSAVNKEKIKVAKVIDRSDQNQIVVSVKHHATSNQIYGAYITKLNVDFENSSQGRIVASNSIEVSGSSTISESESLKAAIKVLSEQINKDGVLKTLGIIN